MTDVFEHHHTDQRGINGKTYDRIHALTLDLVPRVCDAPQVLFLGLVKTTDNNNPHLRPFLDQGKRRGTSEKAGCTLLRLTWRTGYCHLRNRFCYDRAFEDLGGRILNLSISDSLALRLESRIEWAKWGVKNSYSFPPGIFSWLNSFFIPALDRYRCFLNTGSYCDRVLYLTIKRDSI